MDVKWLFFRFIGYQFVFFVFSACLFLLHIAFWTSNGLAQRLFGLYLTPSSLPLVIYSSIMFICYVLFGFFMFSKLRVFNRISEEGISVKKAFLSSVFVHFLLLIISVFVYMNQDPTGMGQVIPALSAIYFGSLTLLLFIAYILVYNYSKPLSLS